MTALVRDKRGMRSFASIHKRRVGTPMIKRWLLPLLLLPVLLLAACGRGDQASSGSVETVTSPGDRTVVTVFRPPT